MSAFYPPNPLSTIFLAAQQQLSYKPILLVNLVFVDGSTAYFATDAITWGGNTYLPAVTANSLDRLQQLTPTGIDSYPSASIGLADPSATIFGEYELSGPGFKGAVVTLTFILIDKITGNVSTDAQVKFVGRADAPSLDDKNLTFKVRSKIEVTRVTLPNVPVSKLCPYPFPGTAAEQLQAKDPTNLYSPCGYLDGLGVNDPSTMAPFTTCNYDILSCQARGMYIASGKQNVGRFGAVQYEPPTAWANPHVYTSGQTANGWNTDNQSKYDNYVPLVYGGGLVKGIIANVVGDGNLVRFEVIVAWGDCYNTWSGGIDMVIVNNVVLQHSPCDSVQPGPGCPAFLATSPVAWWQFVNNGARTGASNADSEWEQLFPFGGDPYGSMVVIECVVTTAIQANSNSLPDVLIVMNTGKKVRAWSGFNSVGNVDIASDGVSVTGSGFGGDGFVNDGTDIIQLFIGAQFQQNTVVAGSVTGTTLSLVSPVLGAPYSAVPMGLAAWTNEGGSPDGAGYTGLDYSLGRPVWTIMDMLVLAGAFTWTDFDIQSALDADSVCYNTIPFTGIAGPFAMVSVASDGITVTQLGGGTNSASFTAVLNGLAGESVFVGQLVGVQDPATTFITYCIVDSITSATELVLQTPGYGGAITSANFLISHSRYKTNLVLQQRQSMAPLLNSLKLGCNMNIIVNNATNLLQFYIDQGLGDQQPNPIPGSNDNTPYGSYLATGGISEYTDSASIMDGRVGIGYVAWNFNETNILLDGDEPNYTSSLNIVQAPPTDTPNRIITPFQNEEITYEADTSTRVDTDDYTRMQQTFESTVQMAGVPNYDQLFRRANNYMARQFRGNPRSQGTYGDTGGSLIVELKAPGMQVGHLRVGHIVSVNSSRLGWGLYDPSNPDYIPGPLFRIQSIQASDNFAVATLTMSWHDDRWFLDGYGNGPDPRFSISATSALSRPPFAWQPYGGTQAYFGTDDPIYPDLQTWFPSIAPLYVTRTDGSIEANLVITGQFPVNQPSKLTTTPYVSLQGTVDVSSGTVPEGTYFIAVVGMDSTGAVSLPQQPQEMCRVTLSAAGSLIVPLILWRTGAAKGAFFVGTNPNFMSFQGYIMPVSGHLPTTLTITSLEGAASPSVASFPMPDQLFDHALINVKVIRHAGPVGDLAGSIETLPPLDGGGYGIHSGYGGEWSAHQWDGYSAALIGNSTNLNNQLLINFTTGNSTAGDYITCPADLVTVLAIQPRTTAYIIYSTPTISTDGGGNTVLTDANWDNGLGPHGNNVGIASVSGFGVTPIQITTTQPHGFTTGDSVDVFGITSPSNTNANGTWTVTVLDTYNFTVAATGNGDGTFPGSDNLGVFCWISGGLAVGAEAGKTLRVLNADGSSWTQAILSNTQTSITLDGPSRLPLTSDSVYLVEESNWNTVVTTPSLVQTTPLTPYQIIAPISNYEDETILVEVVLCDALGNPCNTNQCPLRMIWVFGKEAYTQQSVGITVDGGGVTPATGLAGSIYVPYNCTVTGWTIVADQPGTLQVDVQMASPADYPTTFSIVASLPPVLPDPTDAGSPFFDTTAQIGSSTDLTGWDIGLPAGYILDFYITSIATITRFTLQLQVVKSLNINSTN